jgi:hypothetical protein
VKILTDLAKGVYIFSQETVSVPKPLIPGGLNVQNPARRYMNSLKTRLEEIPSEYQGLGGRALSSTVVAREVDPTCNPVGR